MKLLNEQTAIWAAKQMAGMFCAEQAIVVAIGGTSIQVSSYGQTVVECQMAKAKADKILALLQTWDGNPNNKVNV